MSISTRLKGLLDENQIPYSVMTHTTAYTAQGAAATMQISVLGNDAHYGLHGAGCSRYHADLWKRACQDRRSVEGRGNDSGHPTGAESRETR